MSFSTLMIIKAVVCLGFGPTLLIAPGPLLTLLGVEFGPGAAFMGREYGAALVGNLLLTWFARKADPSTARRAIVLDLFVYDAIGLVVSLLVTLSGGMNWLGWGIVGVYLFFTIGFGYYWLAKK
jgi:hypothetical protein